MKKHLKLQILIAMVLLALNGLSAAIAPVNSPTDSIIELADNNSDDTYFTLRKGTTITLRLVEPIKSSAVEKGNLVGLEVYGDVVVDGKVLIATGTYAEGEISKKRKPGVFGRGAVLEVNASNLRTVDGQRISLKSKGLRKIGGNRTFFAYTISTLVPAVGIAVFSPWFSPFVVSGLLVKGKEAEIPKGTFFTAYIGQDVRIKG